MARLIGFLKVIGTEDSGTFMVRIGTSWYEMSRDANMPNGVCIYFGESTNAANEWVMDRPEYTGDLPQGMVKQIMALIQMAHDPLIQASVATVKAFNDDDDRERDGAIERMSEALTEIGLEVPQTT